MIDQLQRMRELVGKVTYKPGWKFKVETFRSGLTTPHPWDSGMVYLTITAAMPSLDGGGATTAVHLQRRMEYDQLARMKDADVLTYWITQCILELEKHELDEWFKFDGFHVRDPHP